MRTNFQNTTAMLLNLYHAMHMLRHAKQLSIIDT